MEDNGISELVARRRQELSDQIIRERGEVTARDAALLEIYCGCERQRLEAIERLKLRGQIESHYTGRNHTERENKAFAPMIKAGDAAARILNLLFAKKKPGRPDLSESSPEELDEY